MSDKFQPIALALAGLCQAAKLVQLYAQQGSADSQLLRLSLQSIVETQPENLLDIYGGQLQNLRFGLEVLLEQLQGADPEVGRYWLNLLALENKLHKNASAKQQLAQRIQRLPSQLQHYDLLDEPILASLASIYVDLISPLGSRIQVNGNLLFLQQTSNQNKIRACLLAGIRAAVLWRQMGGNKWQFLFARRKIIAAAQQLLDSL